MNRDYQRRFDLFCKVLDVLEEGMKITFTPDNIADGDDFLLFGYGYTKQTLTFKRMGDLWVVVFENDEPMLLENCPDSFYRSILKNAK